MISIVLLLPFFQQMVLYNVVIVVVENKFQFNSIQCDISRGLYVLRIQFRRFQNYVIYVKSASTLRLTDVTNWRERVHEPMRDHSELSQLLVNMSALLFKASNCNAVNAFYTAQSGFLKARCRRI